MVDPKAAEAVLHVLEKLLKIKIDIRELKKKAEETERLLQRMQEMESKSKTQFEVPSRDEEPSYIG